MPLGPQWGSVVERKNLEGGGAAFLVKIQLTAHWILWLYQALFSEEMESEIINKLVITT